MFQSEKYWGHLQPLWKLYSHISKCRKFHLCFKAIPLSTGVLHWLLTSPLHFIHLPHTYFMLWTAPRVIFIKHRYEYLTVSLLYITYRLSRLPWNGNPDASQHPILKFSNFTSNHFIITMLTGAHTVTSVHVHLVLYLTPLQVTTTISLFSL